MPDRVPSDHESVETRRVAVERIGRTDRPRVVVPTDVDLADGDLVRFALGGDQYHALVETDLDDDLVVNHVADNRRLARERAGENRLTEWVADAGVPLGGSVHLDIVTRGSEYGLRTPGSRVVYTTTDEPRSSLSDIAENLDT